MRMSNARQANHRDPLHSRRAHDRHPQNLRAHARVVLAGRARVRYLVVSVPRCDADVPHEHPSVRQRVIAPDDLDVHRPCEPRALGSCAALLGLSNEGGIGNTRFLRNCMGTWIVQELLRVWEIADGKRMGWDEVDTITPAAPAFTAFIDPDDKRFYNPANMEQAVRSFIAETGQTAPSDRGTILRCVYESLALKYRYVNETINRVTGTETEVVHIVGGGSNNPLLNQFTADSVGVPVLAGPKEATAVGNLMVQAIGAGVIPDLKAAMPLIKAAFPITTFKPQNTAAWDMAYARFTKLLK